MKKNYSKPTSDIIVIHSVHLLAGSLPAGGQENPGMGAPVDFDDIEFDEYDEY